MRKYDKHSLSSSALLAEDYRRITRSSWALIPCIYPVAVNHREQLPAGTPVPWLPRHLPPRLLVFWNSPAPTSLFGCRDCSLSGWTPRAAPRRPRVGRGPVPAGHPARAPGEQRSRRPRPCPCKEHLPRAPAGRGGASPHSRAAGLAPEQAAGILSTAAERLRFLRWCPFTASPFNAPSRGVGFWVVPLWKLLLHQRLLQTTGNQTKENEVTGFRVETHGFLSYFSLFFRTGYSVSFGGFTGAFCREDVLPSVLKSGCSVMPHESKRGD